MADPRLEAVRTGNVLVENVIFLDDIVDYLLRKFVDDQHLPLYSLLAHATRIEAADLHLL